MVEGTIFQVRTRRGAHGYRLSVLDRPQGDQTQVSSQLLSQVSYATVPPFPRPVRKVGAPLGSIIALSTVAALILGLLTAVNPGGTALGLVLSTTAMALVLLCYLWLDRWEPEPPRLLIMAFLWGSSVAVLLSVAVETVIERTVGDGGDQPAFATVAIGAPLVEEAAKGPSCC